MRVEACRETATHVGGRSESRHRDRGDVARFFAPAKLGSDGVPIHSGEPDVDENDVGFEAPHMLERRLTVVDGIDAVTRAS